MADDDPQQRDEAPAVEEAPAPADPPAAAAEEGKPEEPPAAAPEEEKGQQEEPPASAEELPRAASKGADDKEDKEKRDKRDRKEDKDDKLDSSKDEKRDKDSKKSSRRSRSRSRDKRSKRSRSRDRKSSRRSRSGSRDRRRRRSRSRSRDRKKSSRRSRSRSRDRRRRRSRTPSSDEDNVGGYEPRRPREPPVVTNGPGTGADPFASMRPQIQQQDPQAQLRAWQLQQLEARAMILDQQAKSAATATSKTQREVYVGGLMPNMVGGEALRTLFNSALAVQFAGYLMPGMDPVINVNLHPAGKYAFVEFRAPEMATAALALHGQVQLLGCTISVARPSGYVDPNKAISASQAAAQAVTAFKRGDMQALAAAALAGANLKNLGLPPHIEDPAAAAAPPQLPPGVVIEGVTGIPTTCLCFLGMVTADRLKDDQEYEDMKLDLKDQFDELVPKSQADIKVPRPHDPSQAEQYIGIGNYGKIFTKMASADAATVCRDRLNGRMYGGQLVQVYFITEEAFAAV